MKLINHAQLRATIERCIVVHVLNDRHRLSAPEISAITGLGSDRVHYALHSLQIAQFVEKSGKVDTANHPKFKQLNAYQLIDIAAPIDDKDEMPVRQIRTQQGRWRLDHALPVRSVFDMGVAA